MRTTLSKHGDNFALILEPNILEDLGAKDGTLFEITTDGETLILSPVQEQERNGEFEDALAKANILYFNALKRLAE